MCPLHSEFVYMDHEMCIGAMYSTHILIASLHIFKHALHNKNTIKDNLAEMLNTSSPLP